jgi:hypothetical protein
MEIKSLFYFKPIKNRFFNHWEKILKGGVKTGKGFSFFLKKNCRGGGGGGGGGIIIYCMYLFLKFYFISHYLAEES